MKISEMNSEQIASRVSQMPGEIELRTMSIEEIEKNTIELRALESRKQEINDKIEARDKLIANVLENGKIIPRKGGDSVSSEQEQRSNDKELEMRAFKKHITKEVLSLEERSILTTVGAGAVIPKNVSRELLKNAKYSDLLHRATIIQGGQFTGTTTVPLIAENKAAVWKEEGATVTAENSEIKGIELNGYELMRLMTISTATESLSIQQFGELMLNLLGEEVLETLEASFIKGTGVKQATGLDTMVMGDNEVKAIGKITVRDIAKAISKLPNKHARNAIVMGNSATLFELSLLVSENDNTMATGADSFLKKEIVPNEHVADEVVYVVDPSQLYVKFAQPIQMDSDKSRGFREATIDIRALTVVDAKWNPHAVAKVTIEA